MINSTEMIARINRAAEDLEYLMRAVETPSQFDGDNPVERFDTDIFQEAAIQLEAMKEAILAAENRGR